MQFSFIFLNIIFLYLAAQLGGPRSSVVDYVNVNPGWSVVPGWSVGAVFHINVAFFNLNNSTTDCLEDLKVNRYIIYHDIINILES
jgi:hypothetical protein